MPLKTSHRQSGRSVKANVAFFRNQLNSYRANIQRLETYARIRKSINEAIVGARRVVDIGNGGVCDYDTELVGEITAIDHTRCGRTLRLKPGARWLCQYPAKALTAR